eukprot:3197014-Rhodomonas_salina.3
MTCEPLMQRHQYGGPVLRGFAPGSPIQETAFSAQGVPGMQFLVFDFLVHVADSVRLELRIGESKVELGLCSTRSRAACCSPTSSAQAA